MPAGSRSGGFAVWTVMLLVASNLFMTVAWYGHLRFTTAPLWIAVLASWGIALFEYTLQVPANRIGYGQYSATQLKIIQEVVSLTVFAGFAWLYLGERLRWNTVVSFALIVAAVWFAFAFPAEKVS
ncbi:MAG: DMT family protein [Deltaproteobacteria bacterium]|nr:DMT family protein [Deltaproteobacteria bacterium]